MLSKPRSLPLALLQAGIGLMRGGQGWIFRGGHVCYGYSNLSIAANKYLGASITQYLQAIGTREKKAVQSLKPAKQIALFCGPNLYQPDRERKLVALTWYQQIIDALIPKGSTITNPYLWHNDLHGDNIFADPCNPKNITGIIDWQSCHIAPLFNQNPDPAFLNWDNLEPETLDLAPRPNLSELLPEERATAIHNYATQNVFIGWRKLMFAKNPDLYRVIEFRKTPAYGLIFLAHRIFEYGEAHFQSLLIDLKDSWGDLPTVTEDFPSPLDLSEADIDLIKLRSDGAVAGTELVAEVKKSLGDLWPDKGFIEHERYNDCKAALDKLQAQIADRLAETDEEKAEYRKYWPFD